MERGVPDNGFLPLGVPLIAYRLSYQQDAAYNRHRKTRLARASRRVPALHESVIAVVARVDVPFGAVILEDTA